MKFRKLILVIAFLMLMIAIWCMTPPETSLTVKIISTTVVIGIYIIGIIQHGFSTLHQKIHPIVKFLLTCAKALIRFLRLCGKKIVRLGRLIARPFKALGRLFAKFFNSDLFHCFVKGCGEKVSQFCDFFEDCANKFISWSIQTNPQIIKEKCQAIADQLGYRKQPHHPLYQIKTWFNLTASFCCISVCTGSMILAYQRNIILLIVLCFFNFFVPIYVLISFLIITETKSFRSPTEPILGSLCLVIQTLLSVVMIIIAPALSPEEYCFMDPYFTIQLGPISFTLSVAQFILITSIVLFLTCYSHLCHIIHEIASTPSEESLDD